MLCLSASISMNINMQGSSQKIEANIARATDATGKNIKNVQLQNPVRIIINKSPVMVNYRLYQVGVRFNGRLHPIEQCLILHVLA